MASKVSKAERTTVSELKGNLAKRSNSVFVAQDPHHATSSDGVSTVLGDKGKGWEEGTGVRKGLVSRAFFSGVPAKREPEELERARLSVGGGECG